MIEMRSVLCPAMAACSLAMVVMAATVPVCDPPPAAPPSSAPAAVAAGAPVAKILAETRKGVAIAIPAQVNLRVGGYFSWKMLTSAAGMETVSGITIDAADHEKTLEKVGDSLTARMWNDNGRLVVTAMVGSRELRVVFEPENGSYLCGKRFIVAQVGEGSMLQYWNQYTDYQPNPDNTENKTREDMAAATAAFKALVEKKGISATHPGHSK